MLDIKRLCIIIKIKQSSPHWWNQWKCRRKKIKKLFIFIVFWLFRIK